MATDYTAVMAERTDLALAKILSEERDQYQPEAIEAAQKEFEKRNLHLSDFSATTEEEYTEEALAVETLAPVGFSVNQTYNLNIETKPDMNSVYDEERKKQAGKDMLYGGLWFAGGLIATMADVGAIFWGAMVFGGIQFFRGLSNN